MPARPDQGRGAQRDRHARAGGALRRAAQAEGLQDEPGRQHRLARSRPASSCSTRRQGKECAGAISQIVGIQKQQPMDNEVRVAVGGDPVAVVLGRRQGRRIERLGPATRPARESDLTKRSSTGRPDLRSRRWPCCSPAPRRRWSCTQQLRHEGPVASSIHWKTRPGPRYRACFRLTVTTRSQVAVVDSADHVVRVLAAPTPLEGGDSRALLRLGRTGCERAARAAGPLPPPAEPRGRRPRRRLRGAIDASGAGAAVVSDGARGRRLPGRGRRRSPRPSSPPTLGLRAAGLLVAMGLARGAGRAARAGTSSRSLRDTICEFAGAIVGAVVVLAAGAAAMLRWPILLPLLRDRRAALPDPAPRRGRAGGQPAGAALRGDRRGRAGEPSVATLRGRPGCARLPEAAGAGARRW